jgi:transposase
MDQQVYLGIDFHQRFSQLCVLDGAGRVLAQRRCDSSAGEIVGIVRAFGDRVEAAIESSCGAADLAEALSAAGWSVHLAHPGYVARLRQSPDKSDLADARLLADLTRVGYLPRVWLAPTDVRELRRLTRLRMGLAEDRRRVKQRVRGILREHRLRTPLRAWTKAWLAWVEREAELPDESRWVIGRHLRQLGYLGEEIAQVEARLERVTSGDAVVAKLLSIPGIGPVTAWVLRAEIGRFDRFRTGKQLSRFCGLSPRNASSGERVADAGLVKAGDPRLRALLIEAAHRLTMHHPRWRLMRERMRARGKPGSVIAAAVANRWVRGLVHEMREAGLPEGTTARKGAAA